MASEKILAKLKKVWEHYEGAMKINSEEEANTAATILQKMLMQYNLTMDEFKSQMTNEQRENEVVEEYMSFYTKKSIGGYWELELMKVITKWNLCRTFLSGRKRNKMMVILGRKENVEMCKWLHSMLMERYVRFSRENFAKYQETASWLLEPIGLDTYQRKYLLGCADGLNEKYYIEDQKNRVEDEQFDAQCTALVVRNNGELDLYQEQKWGKIGTFRTSNIRSGEAYHKGVEDGRNTSLHKPLTTTKANDAKLLS